MLSTIERRNEIVNMINEVGRLEVQTLAEKFNVSTVTIRADLNDLDNKRLLIRSRGGAIAAKNIAKELSVKEKHCENNVIKGKIADAAIKLINDGEVLLLDSGTTTEQVAKKLGSHKDLVVMTNGLNIANELANLSDVEVMMTGGKLRQKSLSFYGRQAEASLENLRFDKLILGVDGIDDTASITTHFEQEASLNRVMCRSAKQIIVVADSSKFAKSGFHIILNLSAIDVLITDSKIPESYKTFAANANVKLIIVD
ncbi:DeoR/GlpR transcriptional regulator [Parashewanella curva]|uniref:DeoR/GlpR transcriptional regulator n=1 Tax=Parashewanella curva TaxID=2338552 RepID=A0A3L8PUN7_9GAMM|nr:transcriptional repressor AgaR [Parashewanella curva]RLV59121.1 DeoR/GlpR transcriptional regulator [Parashewanella curva]